MRRRRVVSACLWIAAPAIWLTRYALADAPGEVLAPIELAIYLIAASMFMVSAVGLTLRPELARGLGLAALLASLGALAFEATNAPPVAFVATALAALLGFGLVTIGPEPDVPMEPAVDGMLWSRGVLLSSALSLTVGSLSLANEIALFSTLRPLVSVLFFSAGLIATYAEWIHHRSGRRSKSMFAGAALATLVGGPLGWFSWLGLAISSLRLIYAMTWAARERRLPSDLLGLARLRPAPFAFASFGLGATGGALLLALPFASTAEGGIPLVDALFTATSAICVTGLAVVDTSAALTTGGQAVVLLLIQIGGLGIMTLSAMITLAVGQSLSGRDEQAVSEAIGGHATPAGVFRTIRSITIGTISIETAGAVALYLLTRDQFDDTLEATWFAVFHAVSAFCNAGFALQPDSLVPFRSQPAVMHVFSALIILGGAGFGVMYALVDASILRARRALGRRPTRRPLRDVNTRLVALTTLVLLVGGFAGYAALEWDATLRGASLADRLHNAWFQSVTFRTAGFNSVDLSAMRPATLALSLLLMFVGASPGSTGGGIKTTTVAVLVLSLGNVFRGRPDVEAFGRRIDASTVRRAYSVTLLAGGTVFVGTFLLLLTQDARFEVLLFEAVSAVGTVGLTIGGTAILDDSGKFIVMLLMLVGRVGPLTAAAILKQSSAAKHRYPRAEVIVG